MHNSQGESSNWNTWVLCQEMRGWEGWKLDWKALLWVQRISQMCIVNWTLETEVVIMCVVPISVGHMNSTKMFTIYAMLDNCRHGYFIRDELTQNLEITGRKLQLRLKTLTGEKSEDTMATDGLVVSGIDLKKTNTKEWIVLPRNL